MIRSHTDRDGKRNAWRLPLQTNKPTLRLVHKTSYNSSPNALHILIKVALTPTTCNHSHYVLRLNSNSFMMSTVFICFILLGGFQPHSATGKKWIFCSAQPRPNGLITPCILRHIIHAMKTYRSTRVYRHTGLSPPSLIQHALVFSVEPKLRCTQE